MCRIARQSSKLQDEVQLLGRLLRDLRPRGVLDGHATLRRLRSRFDSWRGRLIDAGARRYGGCLQSSFPVGSTPTGVFWKASVVDAARTSGTPDRRTSPSSRCVPNWILNRQRRSVAQLAEHQIITLDVAGSTLVHSNQLAENQPPGAKAPTK